MKNQSLAGVVAIAAICLAIGISSASFARNHSQESAATQKGATVTSHAAGTFDVKLVPQGPEDKTEGSTIAHLSIDKQYHGDLEATGRGEMLTATTSVKGSAGYVAMERISGTLRGRSGTFVLQHSGTMAHGAFNLSVTVVPDSATGQLTGLTGKLTGIVDNGKHSYEFDYTLPETP
jgi:Protein of unknown function (DUF3224)